MKNLAIYGNNYLEVVKLVSEINASKKTYKIIGFLNDLEEYQNRNICGFEVIGGKEKICELISKHSAVFFSNVNSTLKDRKKVVKILEDKKCEVVSLIHPSINLSYASISHGSIIPQGCIVGFGVKIGPYLTSRLSTTISHDVEIGEFVYLGPNVTLCGYSKIGDGAYIGASSTILPKVKVGKKSVIGAGSLVNKDIPDGVIAYGSPARVIKEINIDSYRGTGM